MTKRLLPKLDETGKYLPNSQAAKSGLNKSFADVGLGQRLFYVGIVGQNPLRETTLDSLTLNFYIAHLGNPSLDARSLTP
jgi:hypothetical protein